MVSSRLIKGVRVLVFSVVLFSARIKATIDFDVCNPNVPISQGAKSPTLPKAYELAMLISDSQTHSTRELLLGTDGLLAYTKSTSGAQQITVIGDYPRNQRIEMIATPPTSSRVQCLVTDLKDAAAKGQWLFGYNQTRHPHPDDPGWVFQFNDFKETFTGNEVIMGIPCNRWEACKVIQLLGGPATVGFKVYWSDPEQWTPVAGMDETKRPYSVPVLMETTRKVKGNIVQQQSYIVRYSNRAPPMNAFQIPEGVFCPGLSTESVKPPTLPQFASYASEIIWRDGFTDIVLNQKTYFDGQLNLSRIDFSLQDKTAPATLLHDMQAGLSYLLDKKSATCIVSPIDGAGSDLHPSAPNTGMRLINPLVYLQRRDINYTYYEMKKERGVPASLFKGLQAGPSGQPAIVYEFWFSAAFQRIEGVGTRMSNKPLKFLAYPEFDPEQPTVQINIFDFDEEGPGVLEYDISTCTPREEQLKLHFSLHGRYDNLSLPDILQFKHQLLTSLRDVMLVSPLRLHNIQLGATEQLTVVNFTLLPPVKVHESNGHEFNAIASKEAVDKLRTAINAGRLVVEINGTAEYLRPVKGSLEGDDAGITTPLCSNSIPPGPKIPMPQWDPVYSAAILVNDGPHKPSYELHMAVEGDKAFVKRIQGGVEVTLIGDYNRQQVIAMTKPVGEQRARFCMTKNLEEAARDGTWIFGNNKTVHPHPDDPEWVFHYNAFQEQYVGKSVALGIPCNQWEACQEVKFRDGSKLAIRVRFYWSDPERWISPSGSKKAVPVKIEVATIQESQTLVQEFRFMSYSNHGPSEEMLKIPQGVYCLGLKSENVLVPKVPDYFSFDSEIIIRIKLEELVFYQKHYVDDVLQLIRMDFIPFLDDQQLPDEDGSRNTADQMTQIHDFQAGLSYLIQVDADMCLVTSIDENSEHGQAMSYSDVRMRNPMAFLKLQDVNYTYYQTKKVRDIPAIQFMGLQKGDIDMVYEYWFSGPLVHIQGVGTWTTRKPLKFSMYPVADPDNAIASVYTNIFNFDVEEPDILLYDISSCTPPHQRQHLSFQLPGPNRGFVMPSTLQVKHHILLALADSMLVRPLRIHNIELETDDALTTVVFTLLARTVVKSAFNESSSEHAVDMLRERINSGLLSVEIGLPNGKMEVVTAVQSSLKTLTDRHSRCFSAIVQPN